MFQESDDEFGNPSEDDQKMVWLYTPWYIPERFSTFDTVRVQERNRSSTQLLKIKPDLYNFVWEGCPDQMALCCEIEPGFGLKACLQAIIRCKVYVGWHFLLCVFLRNYWSYESSKNLVQEN